MNLRIVASLIAVWIVGVLFAVFCLVPPAAGLGYLVRIAFFHIPVAWVSVLAFLVSAVAAGQYLRTRQRKYDCLSACSARLGLSFCLLATVSGAVFAKLTWGAYWNWDPRQTTVFILLLIYGAYLALRTAIEETERRAAVSAVYALLSCLSVPFLVFIIPRMYFSLHPEPVLNGTGKVAMEPIMLYVLLAAVGGATALYCLLLTWSFVRTTARPGKGLSI
ncbi:Heme exporter protein C [Sporomusa ovata DSM 2662]|uniref:Heme exporter protein C n=1 Tax=Sporomusa ovata TaxID=2378 RepID=A0A0U1L1Z1_9FIRM|nr:cytochrome c biogenesis protein CcsA [Sporomusa ovata]EQB25141.1 cytochrome c assembly protein [Sporomusa ovata DSM 2662]CQR73698.1 Cytochrome c-type biogenesis protein CcmC, putative heme lyase for CcmE [Sporomusa ovata]